MSFAREVVDGIATVTMDDGKVNALDLAFLTGLNDVLDDCADDDAVVLVGRQGMFSAGLNMKVMTGGDDDLRRDTLATFGRTMLRVWLEPRPVVAAVTGHAIAGGTFLAMVCDHAVAADGDFKWGLVETTIRFPMPRWGIAIARGNVRADRLDDLILPGRFVTPVQAVEVGFADELADPGDAVQQALARARELAELDRPTYADTKQRLRGAAAEEAAAGIDADTALVLGL